MTRLMQAAGEPVASSAAMAGEEPTAPRYEPPPRRAFVDLLARLIVAFVRWYAAAFREIWPLSVLWPAPSLLGIRLLVRYDHVVEALGRPDVFKVPFGEEMARLNDGVEPGTGTPFLLGIDNPVEHVKQARCLMARLELPDIPKVARMSFDAGQKLLRQGTHPFEAIHGLITAVPIEVCRSYFGIPIEKANAQRFAAASIVLSGHLFGKPPIKRSKQWPKPTPEDKAGDYVRFFVNRAIKMGAPDTVAAKLSDLSEARARAILMGMVVGFVPTNTLAGGHILDVLLSKVEAMDAAVNAARAGDDDRLWQCLIEALRLRPINLGPFRVCEGAYRFDTTSIAHGKRVWAMTASAMRDSQRIDKPDRFNPQRTASSYLHFGFGMHWCIGAMLARAQLTQTFKALLRHGKLTRTSALKYRGLFPDSLTIAITR